MAKLEKYLYEDFDSLLSRIEAGILKGSFSATMEAASDVRSGDARCSVRVFERFSAMGGNRLSMSLTLFQNGNEGIHLIAVTSGGSTGVFKMVGWGEDAFLDKLRKLL